MMIECELCHEWYHGKCLKIARGKVKEDDKYTCPICDWRVKIPRDAARPKLEDLMGWQDEIAGLPFQPEEEEVLRKIIDNAQEFRNHISAFCNPVLATASEADTQRFFLRKIEGAEILLSHETNFFRQELHKWSPVAPQPPPLLEVSKSTRKPRPTKLQRMLAQHGVEDPDDLPENLRSKANSLKRKAMNAEAAAAAVVSPVGPSGSATAGGNRPADSPTSQSLGSGNPFFTRGSQPSTPTVAGGPHGHHNRGSDSSASSRPGSSLRPDAMDVDAGASLHPNLFMGNGSEVPGPQLTASDSSLSLEERLSRGLDDGIDLSAEDRVKVLDILSRSEKGRRQAEEMFGPAIWGSRRGSDFGRASDLEQNPPEDKDVDKMFADLTNGEDDEMTKKDEPKKESQQAGDQVVTADSLEAERDAMDMMDSD
jgi:histone demethylase JARID1